MTLGLELTDFRIENLNFTEKTLSFIDKITEKKADVQALNQSADIDREALGKYAEMEKLNIMGKAAENDSSMGDMMGAGMGMAMGAGMAQQMQGMTKAAPQEQEEGVEVKLQKLKSLFEKNLISQEEYDQKKAKILSQL